MAIADRINEMYTHVGDVYDTITNVDLPTNKNIQNIPQTIKDSYLEIMNNGIDTIWNNWEKVTGSGTSISLSPTVKAPMKNELKGNTSQTGTPTPSSPIDVNVVSGDNTITISNQGGTDSNTYNIDLPVENLFDKDTTNIFNGYISTTGFNSYANNRTIYIPTIVGQTYTIQKTIGNRNLLYAFIENKPAIGAQTLLGRTDVSSKTATVTAPTNGNYLAITIYRDADSSFTVDEVLGGLQIEKGSKANSYTPYGTTPIELCKIGNYQDYFYKDSGKWYLHKEIGKVVLNGSESWGLSETNTNTFRFVNDNAISNIPSLFTTTDTFMNNRFIEYKGNNGIGSIDSEGLAIRDNKKGFTIRMTKSVVTDLAGFKTWLGANNVTVYYVLATPTSEGIPTNLINQLEQFYQAQSKNNQTNISQVNNDLPFIISASALKKG